MTYARLNLPPDAATASGRARHVRFTALIPAEIAKDEGRPWALEHPAGRIPVQTRWLGRPLPTGRVLCVDAVTDHVGEATLVPVDEMLPVPQGDGAVPLIAFDPKGDPRLTFGGREHSMFLHYAAGGLTFRSGRGEQSLEIVDQGPIVTAVEVEGACLADDGTPGLAYRWRITLFTGLPVIVMRLWFIHDLPGVPSCTVDSMAIEMTLPGLTRHHVEQLKFGLQSVPRAVCTDRPLRAGVGQDGATAWRLLDAAPLGDDTDYPPYLMPPSDEVGLWLAASGKSGWIAATMDDLRAMRPKGMAIGGEKLTLEIWPDWAQPMVLPQGRSRSLTWRMALGDDAAAPTAATIKSVLATTSPDPLLAQWDTGAHPAAFFDLDQLLPHQAGRSARFDHYLQRLACPPTVADMFDLGDTPDPGYQTTYLATGRRIDPLVPGQPVQPIQFHAGGHFPATPWSDLSQFEQVWANNEYDIIWCIACEALRARNAALLQPLRWYARHAIEVDFVHYSDHRWKDRCTPAHSMHHTSTGAYPSHFWTEGVLAHYLLTGDDDALEFALAIGDKIIEFFSEPAQLDKLWHPTRELGWALLATAALATVDDDPQYADISRRIADTLVAAPIDDAVIANMVQYSFGFASLLLGVDRWHRLEPQPRYRDWIVSTARQCAAQAVRTPSVSPSMTIAILYLGYRHSGDEQLLRVGMRLLEQLMDTSAWYDPPRYAKPAAVLYRPLARFFAAADRHDLLQHLNYRFP